MYTRMYVRVLNEKHMAPVHADNRLLQTMIALAICTFIAGGAAWIEHPSESWKPDLLQWLTMQWGIRCSYVDQCMTGAPSRKPTDFLSLGMPSENEIAQLPNEGLCDQRHTHVALRGKCPDGSWATPPLSSTSHSYVKLWQKQLLLM